MFSCTRQLLVIPLLIVSCFTNIQAQNFVLIQSTDTEQEIVRKAATLAPTPRQLRWQQLELTGFFHFGINTFTNREWGTGKEDPALFNPSQLDAMQWVSTAKDVGIKQVIITAKHHDGFCLWPTTTTKHSVAASPWKNGTGDVVKEVSDACKKLDIGFGIYLSPWDMNSPLYGTDAYNGLFVEQLTELLTNYGRIDEVWFDGANGEGPNGKKQVYDFERWYKLIRTLQPQAVIAIMGPDVRWVGTETGYGRETEWSVVPANNMDPDKIAETSQQDLAFKPQGDMMGDDLGSREKIRNAKALVWYPAETDVSIRPGWFFHEAENEKVKSPEKLLDIYFHSVGRNGVLLLNIPPDTRGLIHERDIEAFQGWKNRRDEIFSTNVMKIKKYKPLWDNNDGSTIHWPKKNYLEITFSDPTTFNVMSLQENIRKGQRIEAFELEYKQGAAWIPIVKGTTVGYKRLMRFPSVTATAIRLKINAYRMKPQLSEFGLYFDPKK
jgi:alpha-L-fucosidase